MGESVKIAIPYSVILDVDRSTAMDFSETIEVKVMDRDHFAMDSYFFAYFHSLPEALAQIHEVVHAYKRAHPPAASQPQPSTSPTLTVPQPSSSTSVSDTTLQRSPSAASRLGTAVGAHSPSARNIFLPVEEPHSVSSQTGFSFTSFLRPSVPNLLKRTPSSPESTPQERPQLPQQDPAHDYTHVFAADPRASPVPSLSPSTSAESTATDHSAHTARPGPEVVQPLHPARYGLTYPPSVPPLPPTIETTPSDYVIPGSTPSSHRSSWSGVVPSWLKTPSRRLFFAASGSTSGGTGSSPASTYEIPAVVEQLTRPEGSPEEEHRDSELSSSNHLGFSILETPQGSSEQGQDALIAEKFRKQFALDEKEQLIGC
jgi:sterol 3beta-glucosyltransferase